MLMPSRSGVELAAVMADADRACLVLETGVSERFRYGRYRRTPESTAEAQAWEEAKRGVKCDTVLHGCTFITAPERTGCCRWQPSADSC